MGKKEGGEDRGVGVEDRGGEEEEGREGGQ